MNADIGVTVTDMRSLADANNNNAEVLGKCEKYSLRPRTILKRGGCGRRNDDDDNNNNNNNTTANNHHNDKKELETWKPRSKCKKISGRVKQKPAPLSKYRRKTANARERCRMREINEGFEALRRVLPHVSTADCENNNEKLTKISTLRLAMKYIAALNRILQDGVVSATDAESDGDGESCSFFSGEYASTVVTDMSDQSLSLTPPAFADHRSFCTDFSDQLLSPLSVDFADSILPNSTSDLNSGVDLTVSAASALPLANDFTLSDFVLNPSSSASFSSSSSLSSSSSTTSDHINPLDGCLPEIQFDDSEYAFDNLSYIVKLS